MNNLLNFGVLTAFTIPPPSRGRSYRKEMDVKGVKAWLIESIPRSKKVIKETGYTKSLLIVRQDNYFVIRAVHWVKDGGYLKYIDVKTLGQIEGIWVATEMHVTKKKGKQLAHKTIKIEVTNY